MRRIVASLMASAVVIVAVPSWAKDRPVSDHERPKLEDAIKAAGCSGGKMEFDDDDDDNDKAAAHPAGKFEVDDATCADGKKYDLAFDPEFKLLTKKLD